MLGIETLHSNSKKLFNYLTKYYGYNAFIIDDVPRELVIDLRDALSSNNRVKAIQIYLKLDAYIDTLRDNLCYNQPSLPYKSSFRNIAKDLYRELEVQGFTYNEDLRYIRYILRFISTSDYYIIREFLVKRSQTMYTYWDIPLDPDDFYCGYIPIEAILDYCIKICNNYLRL